MKIYRNGELIKLKKIIYYVPKFLLFCIGILILYTGLSNMSIEKYRFAEQEMIFVNFSQRIATLLVETNHSQAELSRFIGVKANTVSDWINKGTSPKIEHLYRIADFFSISFDYLFVGKNSEVSNTPELNENEQEMLDVFQKFNDREQIKLIGRLEELYRQKQIQEDQQKKVQKAYIAARSFDDHPPELVTGDFSDIINAPDATDEY